MPRQPRDTRFRFQPRPEGCWAVFYTPENRYLGVIGHCERAASRWEVKVDNTGRGGASWRGAEYATMQQIARALHESYVHHRDNPDGHQETAVPTTTAPPPLAVGQVRRNPRSGLVWRIVDIDEARVRLTEPATSFECTCRALHVAQWPLAPEAT